MAPWAEQRQEVAFWGGGVVWSYGWCSDGQGLSGRGGGHHRGGGRNIQSRGRRCSLGRREPELRGWEDRGHHGAALGVQEGGWEGKVSGRTPGVSLQLPRYSIG